MSQWSSVVPTWTPVAVADTANMTDNGHHTVQGGSGTQRLNLAEVVLQGQAPSTSSPCIMVIGRTSTIGATLTAARLAAVDPSAVALAAPPLPYIASTTKPQRSATLGMLLSCSFNAYGGIFRYQYQGIGQQVAALGNTQPLGELSLNAFTGGSPGLIASEIILEPA
jgi:hypothetical protein